jgi:hypothetical protein
MIGLRLFLVAVVVSQAVFRGRADVVELVVSVTNGRTAEVGLAASDFRVTASGVVQTVEVADNSVRPVDVTMAVAVDDNRIYRRADVSPAVRRIVAALRPDDRIRVFLTDANVRDATGWIAGGTRYTLDGFLSGPPGQVGDAVVLAMAHQPAPGRGHLILGISHWMSAGAIVDSVGLLEVARRSTAVAHLIRVNGWRSYCYGGNQMMPRNAIDGGFELDALLHRDPNDAARLRAKGCEAMVRTVQAAAEVTGGRFAEARGRDPIYTAFQTALEDFRDSYVLYFTPTGVPASGWHALNVTVPKLPRAQIRALSGY